MRSWIDAAKVAALLVVVLCRSADAQNVTGSLGGRLVGTDGQPLAEAEVIASGAASPQAVRALSDGRGNFWFLSLPAGVYAVRIRSIGFRPVLYDHVVIGLGQATTLGVVAMEAAEAVQLDEIIVSAMILPIDVTTASTGTNLRADEMGPLPLDRSLNSLISLAPEATYQLPDLSYRSEGVNIAGGSIWDNGFFVDGVNVTDPAAGAHGINLPYNFIQEIQVRTGGYEAEFGRAMGGIVNAITPSGGNEFHGQLFTFFTNDGLRTEPQYGLIQTHLDAYSEYDVGASLGGPVLKDRLWFFLAYNPLIDVRDASYTGIAPQRDRQTQHRFAGKLTWQPGMSTRFALIATGDPTVHDGVAPILDRGPPKSVISPDAVLARLLSGGYALSLHAEHAAGQHALYSATLSHSAYRDDFGPQLASAAILPRFSDTTGAWSGGYGGSGYSHFGRDAAVASVEIAAGSHTIKIGGEYESNTLKDFVSEGVGQEGGFLSQNKATHNFTWLRTVGSSDVATRVLTSYLQDSWSISNRIRLNAGLRWEGQWWVGYGRVAQSITDQWAPRVGIVITPDRAGSQKFFASVGRFYEQVPLGALSIFYGTGSQYFTRYTHDPRVDSTGGTVVSAESSGVYASVPNLRGEYYDEATIGYERMLGRSTSIQARLVFRAVGSVIEDSYDNNGAAVYGNPGRGALDSFPQPDHRYRALEVTVTNSMRSRLHYRISYVLSRNWGNYSGLYAPEGSPPNSSIQFDNRDSLSISTGSLPNDRTHVVKMSGFYLFGFGLRVGASAWWQSGTPLSEFGALACGCYTIFLQPRGTSGRTPATWDLNLRFNYSLRHGAGPDVILDLNHIGSPRGVVGVAQQHYTAVDSVGNQIGPAPTYLNTLVYQPAMFARLGVILGF